MWVILLKIKNQTGEPTFPATLLAKFIRDGTNGSMTALRITKW
jgi:hypothetical protein